MLVKSIYFLTYLFIVLVDGQGNDNALKKVVRSYFSHFGNCFSMTFLFLAQVVNATLISCLPVFFIYSLAVNNGNVYTCNVFFCLILIIFILDA